MTAPMSGLGAPEDFEIEDTELPDEGDLGLEPEVIEEPPGTDDTEAGDKPRKPKKSKKDKDDKKLKKAADKAAKEGEKTAKKAEAKAARAARRKQLLEYLAFFCMGGGTVLGLAYGQFSWGSDYRDHMGRWAVIGFLVGTILWIAICVGSLVNSWRKELKEDLEG